MGVIAMPACVLDGLRANLARASGAQLELERGQLLWIFDITAPVPARIHIGTGDRIGRRA